MPTQNQFTMSHAFIKVGGADLPPTTMDDLSELIVDLSLDLPAMCSMTFHDEKLEFLDDSKFDLGKPVEVEMSDPDNPDTGVKIFKGEIVAIEPHFEEGTAVTLTVRAYDKSHRMHRETKSKVWLNVTDSDIVQQIASSSGLTAVVDSTTEVYKHIFQDALSDMDFLKLRAYRIGYEVYVDDEKLYFKKPDPTGAAIDLEWGVTLMSFRPQISGADQMNEVVVKGWDSVQKKEIIGTATSSNTHATIGYGKAGGAASTSAFSAAKKLEVRIPVQSQADANNVAKGILNLFNSQFIEAEGRTQGNPKLKPAVLINVKSVGTRFAGNYKLTSARHTYNLEKGYFTDFTVEGPKPEILSRLLGDHSSTPYGWMGVVTAVVTNNNIAGDGQNASNDYGQVKIKYPWLDDQLESFWARLVIPGGGMERGIYFMPEVNDEVLVAFEQGDFNRPYIIGGLYNGSDKPAEPVSKVSVGGKVKTRIIRTRTGHIIRFTDDDPGGGIEIIDAKQNTKIHMDAQGKKITLDSKGDLDMTTIGNITLKATGKIDIEATQGLTLKGMTVDMKGQSSANLESQGAMTVKGLTLSAQGNTMAELKGGATTIIQGGLVKIN